MKNAFLRTAAVASLAAFAGTAGAAEDGFLSTDGANPTPGVSTGTSVVTIIKDNAVQITKVDDLNFGNVATLTGTGSDNVLSDKVCVFSSTGLYDVDVSSASGFALGDSSGTSTDTIAYDVTWGGTAIATGGAAVALAGETGNNANLDCSDEADTDEGGVNAEFGVTLDVGQFNAAAPATYTDTVTITISPS